MIKVGDTVVVGKAYSMDTGSRNMTDEFTGRTGRVASLHAVDNNALIELHGGKNEVYLQINRLVYLHVDRLSLAPDAKLAPTYVAGDRVIVADAGHGAVFGVDNFPARVVEVCTGTLAGSLLVRPLLGNARGSTFHVRADEVRPEVVKLTMVAADHKEATPRRRISAARDLVGGDRWSAEFYQDVVDSRVWFVANRELTAGEMQLLWEVGDLYACDHFWDGTIAEISERLDAYARGREAD